MVEKQITAEWFAEEVFWEQSYPFMFPESRYIHAETQVTQLLNLAGTGPREVLDLCCGPGRHSVLLAKQGFEVTGVDRTNYLLQKARERAAADQVEVEWITEDMRAFRRPDSFDMAINLFTSFGYFEEDAENRQVLRNVYDSLRPEGVFVIDTLGKETLARVFEPTGADEVPGAGWMIQHRTVTDDWCRINVDWRMIRDDKIFRCGFHHWIYSGLELREMLYEAGFARVTLNGDLSGIPYGPDAHRLVAVACKE